MKKSKKIPKTHLPKFDRGGSTRASVDNSRTMYGSEAGAYGNTSVAGQGGDATSNLYNDKRSQGSGLGKTSNYAAAAAGTLGSYASVANNSNLNSAQRTTAYGQSVNQTVDAVIGAIPVYGQAYGLVSGAKDMLLDSTTSSNINPHTGEKSYKKGTDAAAGALLTPTHTSQINDWTKLANGDRSAETIAGSILPIGSLIGGVKAFTKGDDKYSENEKLIAAENQKQQELLDQQNAAYQQQQNDYINNAIQAGMTSYQNQPQGASIKYPHGGMNMKPNAEIEKQENVVAPNGEFLQANGPSHSEGGVPVALPGNSMIFSDRLKLGKKTFAELNKVNNTSKEDKILESNKFGNTSKRTAELMKFAKNKNSQELFNAQEALKQAKVEAYAKKMGVNLNQSQEVPQEFAMGGEIPYDKSLISLKDKTDSLNYAEGYYKGIKYGSLDEHGNTAFGGRNTSGLSYRNDLMNFSKNFAIRQNVPSSAGEYQGYKDADEKYKSKVNLSNDDVYKLAKSEDGVSDNFFDDSKPLYLKNLSKYDQERVAKLKIYLNNQNSQKHSNGGIQKYPNGGTSGQTLNDNSIVAPSIGQDPRYYTYQGNPVMKPGLRALSKDSGVTTDIGLTNYNQLLNTRTQVRDSNSNVGKILPKFEYLNDPTKGSYDEQFNNYKKLYLPGFKYGGKKLPKYEDGGELEDNPLGYKPTNKVDQMRMQQALRNSQNKPSSSSWLTPEMMQTSSDALIEEGYTNPSSPVINTTPTANTYPIRRDKNGKLIFDTPTSSTSSVGTKRDQELYDEELARMNASGGRDSNKFDWKNTLGQVGNFAAQNAGNIYNLSRYNKPEVERYERAKATLLDPTAAIRNAMEHTRRAEYNVRGASGGNAGTYLSNRVALNAQNINMVDAIRQQYANANAGISNNFAQYNNQLAMQEVIANAQNRARNRSGKGEAIGSLGSNIANQMMDNKKTNMDQETLQLMIKYYNDTPEFQRIMKEYKGKK